MPTPNVARSRSPVAVSQSCLPTMPESSAQLLIQTRRLPAYDNLAEASKPLASGAHAQESVKPDVTHEVLINAESSKVNSAVLDDSLDPLSPSTSSPQPSLSHSLSSRRSSANSSAPSPRLASEPSLYTLTPAEWEVASKRVRPKITSSLFRPFAKFTGTQKSDRQTYNVEVELKYVDMAESFCCGYLKIDGLTRTLASITTYFEGEIIGDKYSFQTKHESWGASEKDDLQHWSQFPAFAPLKPAVKAHRHHDSKFASKDHIFMRWKEHFLVPDHRKSELDGASFEGFYYILLNQATGSVSGIYFHSRSEKFQKLELQYTAKTHRPAAFEFM